MMNLEESTTERVPQSLQAVVDKIIITKNDVQETLQKDLLFALILVLLYENGFILYENSTAIVLPLHVQIENLMLHWKSSDVYECRIVLFGFESIPAKLLMSPLGSIVTVNVVIEKFNQETYSICLPVSRYVPLPRASKVAMIFRDLNFFSMSFKNKIITPLKSKILNHHGYPSASLIGLPEEVLLKIALYLPIKDILSLSEISSIMYNIINNDSIWHELQKRDYDHSKLCESWKDTYKANYKIQKQTERALRSVNSYSGTLHDFMEYSDLVSYIDNPYWDII